MNELWKMIFKKHIASYESIQRLKENGIFDEEEALIHEHNLLFQIIKATELEVNL